MYYTLLQSASVVSEYAVDITTGGYDPLLLARLCFLQMMPMGYLTDQPDEFLQVPVGTGPYRFVEMVPGQHIVLEANEDYWGAMPDIAQVTFRPVPEGATALSALQTGEIDFVRDLKPEDTDNAPRVVSGPAIEFPMMRLQTTVGPLADVNVRRALNHAVDKDLLAEEIFGGFAEPAGQVAAPGIFGYNPDITPYSYDPTKARDMLAEAGAEGAAIRVVCPSGHWLKDREVCQAVASQFEELGLEVQLDIVDWQSWMMEIIADPESQPDVIYMSQSSELLDADTNLSTYFSRQYSIAANWDDPDLNELIAQEKTEKDVAKREALLQEALMWAHDQAPFLFLLHGDNIYGLSERLDWQPRLDGRILASEMSLR
jgi:peptide/nickel transport system substrate-binding protein